MKQIDGNAARALVAVVAIGSAAVAAGACSGGQILPPPLPSTTSAGGAGGMDPSTASSTSSTGGAGGSGGATASSASTSAGSGTGGSAPTCLDAAAVADVLTIKDASLCAVARYDAAEELGFNAPSWGAHGGPLTLRAGMNGTFDLVRWTPPADTKGALTKQEVNVDGKIPMGAFLGGQAVDVPFFGWTALAYTGAFPDTKGELLLVKGSAVDKRYATNGSYATAGISAANAQGRLLLTGLSNVGDAKAGANSLFAADTCGTPAMPALLPGMDATCKAPITVATWGDSSGPVAVDHAGNAFTVMSSFDGSQEARGFDAASIARGGSPTAGVKLFTIPGFGSNLAALAPTATAAGIVAYQPSDGTTFLPQDVLEQRYTVAGGKLAAMGAPTTMLQAATANALLYVIVDDQDRLWVGTDKVAPATGATYVVLARTP
ncbi:MAG: hypothetical protein ABJE95_27120 [Byssovorax sp.]